MQEWVNLAGSDGRKVAKIIQVMQGEELDWQRVHFFIIDERLVPIDHPDSNYKTTYDQWRTLGGEGIPGHRRLSVVH